jgi:hypothetical protein
LVLTTVAHTARAVESHICRHPSSDHKGLVLTNNRRFPRGQPATTGKLVVALERFLHTAASSIALNPSFIHWLQ